MAKSRAALKLNSPIVKLAAVAGAYFLVADPVNTQIDKLLTKVFPNKDAVTNAALPGTVSNMGNWAGAAVEGIPAYMLLMKGRPGMLKMAAGAILAAAALKRALKATGVVSGYQNVPVISGYQGVPVIGRANSLYPNNGYRVNGPGEGYRVNGRNTSSVMGSCDSGTTEGSDLLGG